MGQAQINVRTRACSETFIARTKQVALTHNVRGKELRRLIVGYNHSFRIIMNYPRHCSASSMFVSNGIPSFNELWRKSIYGFSQRVDNSLNKVVNTVSNSTFLSSQLRKHWRSVLYVLPVA